MKTLLVLMLTAGQSPQQFDLNCTQPPPSRYASFAEPANLRIRVDLAANRWCQADCKVLRNIAEVQPGMIFFERESLEEKAHGLGTYRSVDRTNGEYLFSSRFRTIGSRIHLVTEAAVCSLESFSGFPEVETKF